MWKRGGQKFLREEGRFSAPSRSFYSKVIAVGTEYRLYSGNGSQASRPQAIGVGAAPGPVVSEKRPAWDSAGSQPKFGRLPMLLLYCTQGLERFCDMFL